MAAHPETRAFGALMRTRPIPSSFANGSYHSINAFRFIDADGASRAVRWSLQPEAAFSELDRSRFDALNARDPDFLFNDLRARLAHEPQRWHRSEEHTSELQSLMRISYAVFCLKKKITTSNTQTTAI